MIKPLNVFGQAVLSPQSKADVDLLTYQKCCGRGGEVEQLWIQEFCWENSHVANSQHNPAAYQQTSPEKHKFAHAIFSRRFLPWVWWKPCWDRHLGKRCYQATLSPTPQWLRVIQSSLVGATDLKIWSQNTRGSLSVSRTRGAPALPATKPAKKTEVSMPEQNGGCSGLPTLNQLQFRKLHQFAIVLAWHLPCVWGSNLKPSTRAKTNQPREQCFS